MDQKGQHLTLEQMFFFTIGIIILISVFFSYSAIRNRIGDMALDDQIGEIGQTVLSGIHKVGKELEYNDYYETVIDIPQKLGDDNYIVSLANNQLEVRTIDGTESAVLSLESLNETYAIIGSTVSSIDNIKIRGNATDRIIILSRYDR